ncbi:MAG: thermonuclease family protein [Anaerolineaceae bacterium]|nr:thermonuclease family protein [Anaerolineaceae bacterium]
MKPLSLALSMLLAVLLAACTFGFDPSSTAIPGVTTGGSAPSNGDTATVTRIIDGDTIDVSMNGQTYRVRYIGMNTPESDQVCYSEATQANALFVQGKTVRLVKDVSDTDQYGRLLRYVYVGDLFVNQALVEQGFAEVVSYPPDTAQFETFKRLEQQAAAANRGCHPTGIFDDGSYTR